TGSMTGASSPKWRTISHTPTANIASGTAIAPTPSSCDRKVLIASVSWPLVDDMLLKNSASDPSSRLTPRISSLLSSVRPLSSTRGALLARSIFSRVDAARGFSSRLPRNGRRKGNLPPALLSFLAAGALLAAGRLPSPLLEQVPDDVRLALAGFFSPLPGSFPVRPLARCLMLPNRPPPPPLLLLLAGVPGFLSPPMGSLPSRPPTPCLMPPPLLLAGVPGFLSPPLDGLEPKPPNLLPPDDEAGLSLPRSGGRSPPDGADDRNVPMPPGRDAKPPLLEAAGRLSRRSS